MPIQLCKWGNSLAIRLPAALIRQTGWQVNDQVEARLTPAGELVLTPVQSVTPTSVRAGLGRLAGRIGLADPSKEGTHKDDAALLRAVRDGDRRTRG